MREGSRSDVPGTGTGRTGTKTRDERLRIMCSEPRHEDTMGEEAGGNFTKENASVGRYDIIRPECAGTEWIATLHFQNVHFLVTQWHILRHQSAIVLNKEIDTFHQHPVKAVQFLPACRGYGHRTLMIPTEIIIGKIAIHCRIVLIDIQGTGIRCG